MKRAQYKKTHWLRILWYDIHKGIGEAYTSDGLIVFLNSSLIKSVPFIKAGNHYVGQLKKTNKGYVATNLRPMLDSGGV